MLLTSVLVPSMFVRNKKVMKTNMGRADRYIRIVLAVAIAGLYFGGYLPGGLAIGLLVVAAIFVLTSFVGFCPLYFPFGISTKKRSSSKPA